MAGELSRNIRGIFNPRRVTSPTRLMTTGTRACGPGGRCRAKRGEARPCCSLLGLESEPTQAAGFLRSCLCLEVTRSEVCTDAGRNEDYHARHKKAILGQRRSLSLCLTLEPCHVPPRRLHGPVVDTESFPLTLFPPDPSPKERTARKEGHPAEARACLVDTSHQPCQRPPL